MSEAAVAKADERLRVFLSYSRSDISFARGLRERLIAAGFDAYLDVEDIVKGEPWRERLGNLIANADAILFLMSPASIASEICGWEVNEAERLGKRVLPVVARATPEEDVPGRLSRLNYTFLDTPERQAAEFAKLVEALREDADWVREHTRLGEVATRWRAAGEPTRLLLRGADISDAERWRDGRPTGAPDPTELQRSFIAASRRGATRRQRWWIGGVSMVAAGAAALAVVAVLQSIEAAAQRDQALVTQSRFLADLAQQACDASDAGGCLALALEAAPKPDLGAPRPYEPAAEAAVLRGLLELREREVLFAEEAPIRALGVDPDGAWVASLVRTDHQTGRPAVPEDGEVSGRVAIRSFETGEVSRLLSYDAADPDAQSMDVDPRGGAVAVGDRDGALRVIDPETGALLREIDGLNAQVRVTRYSPDGGLLAASAGARAVVFETETWSVVADLDHRVAAIANLAIGTRNEFVAVATQDGYATLWRLALAATSDADDAPALAEGAEIAARAQGERGWALAAEILDGRGGRFVFANGDGALTWRAPDLRLAEHAGGVNALALDAARGRLASASDDGSVRIWDLRNLDGAADPPSLALAGHDGAVTALDWTADDGLVTGGADGVARLWALEPSLAPTPFGGRELFCVNLAGFALGGAAVATGCGDGRVRLWDPQSGAEIWASEPLGDVQPTVALSAGGARAIAMSADGSEARVFDLAGRRELARFDAAAEDGFKEVALDPTGGRAATASNSGAVAVWDVATGDRLIEVAAHEQEIVWIGFSPDGARVVTTSLDGTAKIWGAATGAPVFALQGGESVIWRTLFLNGGAEALTISGEGDVRLWSLADGSEIRRFEGHRAAVRHAAVDPAERYLVTLGIDGVRIWSLETGELLRRFDGFRADAVGFRPDGERLAVGVGRSARIFSVGDWSELGAIPHDANVSDVIFAPSGGGLATTSPFAQLWPLYGSTREMTAAALEAAPRCLTPTERDAAFLAGDAPDWCARAGLWPYAAR